ncbi:transcriptional activator HAP5-like isoform X3 [Dendrobium catenatum]|uniref:Nuclear transcription factor Y subunit C-3 n=1 Tax=Dendrobium catenatum TaxID=906689 RepID=A0A2I0VRN2_9ASPA|nr:transcriptional activator HAP5-like isoform X3 [Dendrobium catenatum]XP_020679875.1 transcriptional activator HAP5-like isoform X3 [Dendrobium catenatum]XP_020679876.1 transcriptional activator HAP5-like isoform X3 [Dendrobium catenatum]PKU66067.1 Nuclear transcription factor Y subunit C-3 [Dendrobium catenatum]
MEAIAELAPVNQPSSDAEETGEPGSDAGVLTPSFPTGRVKRIIKMDEDIKKVSSEALFLISLSTELFIEFMAEKAGNAAARKRRKTVKLEDLRTAITGHSPTADFLLDCLPETSKPPPILAGKKNESEKPLPPGARRIDEFFSKSAEIVQQSR